jgi:hypothetical protein
MIHKSHFSLAQKFEDRYSMFLQNVGIYLQTSTASQARTSSVL